MASTNKTTNYDLSQYIGTDKPTYLGDYNSDMLKIDTQMKANNTIAENATTLATTAKENATNAQTNATEATTKAETAQTTASNAQTTASQAYTQAQTNANNIEKLKNYINLNNKVSIGNPSIASSSTYINKLTLYTNNDWSLLKFYGEFTYTKTNGIWSDSFYWENVIPEQYRPSEDIVIKGSIIIKSLNTDVQQSARADIKIEANGNIGFSIAPYTNNQTEIRLNLVPVLIFIKNFGDEPIPTT